MFKKYMHVEKFGTNEVDSIDIGRSYIFPKIDGTNASLWIDDEKLMAGSRNRELALDNDNAGFYNWAIQQDNIKNFFIKNPNLRLYGEWLVPHSLTTYKDNAWKRFYIFDVLNDDSDLFLSYETYQVLLEEFNLDYIAPMAICTNATSDYYIRELERNNFLIKDDGGIGEGVVIKNYDYANPFGRVIWAKIISSEFKEKRLKTMGAPEIGGAPIEMQIVDKYVTEHLVEKTIAKISNEEGGWNSKYIPRLLQTVFYDLVREETWNYVKENKNPTINYKALNSFAINRVKQIASTVF